MKAPMKHLVLSVLALLPFAASPALGCDLRLLLAMDVSSSIDAFEYDTQRRGLSEAFRDREIIDAIQALDGGALVALTQWGGPGQQHLSIGWTFLRTEADATAFAARIDTLYNPFQRGSTAVGNALLHATAVLQIAPRPCRRTVIDISADGMTNTGMPTEPRANALARDNVTINAVLIQAHDRMVRWYLRNVLRGAGSFFVTARTYIQFPEAIRRKLLREMRPQITMR